MPVRELILGQDHVFGMTPVSNGVRREWEVERKLHPTQAPNGHLEDIYISTFRGHHEFSSFLDAAKRLGFDTVSQQGKDLEEYLGMPAGTWAQVRHLVGDGFMLPSPTCRAFPYWRIEEVERAKALLDDILDMLQWGDGLELQDGEEEEIVIFSTFTPEFPDYLVMMGLEIARAKPFAEISLPYIHFTAPKGTWHRLEPMVEIGGCLWWEH